MANPKDFGVAAKAGQVVGLDGQPGSAPALWLSGGDAGPHRPRPAPGPSHQKTEAAQARARA